MPVADYTLRRDGDRPLVFKGELTAESDGHFSRGSTTNRWHEIRIYKTEAGAYVVEIGYRTQWQGEHERDHVSVSHNTDEVVREIRSYDPVEHVTGYPPGEHYVEKQRRLHADIRARYESQVRDILADLAELFAEHVA